MKIHDKCQLSAHSCTGDKKGTTSRDNEYKAHGTFKNPFCMKHSDSQLRKSILKGTVGHKCCTNVSC